jgi:hypothetical protein
MLTPRRAIPSNCNGAAKSASSEAPPKPTTPSSTFSPTISHTFPALPPVSHNRRNLLSSPLGDGYFRAGMSELDPTHYWVMINFPGRSSVTLSANATLEVANALFDAARSMGAEALAYANQCVEAALLTKEAKGGGE